MKYLIGNMVVDSEYLSHWGILGMKWGIRRFQNPDGSLTEEGRRHRGVNDQKESPRHVDSNARKKAKQQAKNLEAARKAKASKAEYEKGKEKALKSGTATEVSKYKGDLTSQQLNEAINRINNENRLAELVAKEAPKVKTGKDRINDVLGVFDTINKVAGKIADYAGTMDRFGKMFNNSDSEEKERAAKIKKIIAEGDIDKILSNINIMTSNEVNEVKNRLKNIAALKEYKDGSKHDQDSYRELIEELIDERINK